MLVSVQSYFYTFLIRSLFLSEQFGNQCGMEGLNSVVREFKKTVFYDLESGSKKCYKISPVYKLL